MDGMDGWEGGGEGEAGGEGGGGQKVAGEGFVVVTVVVVVIRLKGRLVAVVVLERGAGVSRREEA